MTFKVGDKVRVISDAYGPDQFGKMGTVDEVDRPDKLDVQIEYDTPLRHGLKKNQYRSEHLELIASAGPIRTETVTVRRLEPGVYGRLQIDRADQSEVFLAFSGRGTSWDDFQPYNAHELRELARVALEIAEYLDNVD